MVTDPLLGPANLQFLRDTRTLAPFLQSLPCEQQEVFYGSTYGAGLCLLCGADVTINAVTK